MLLQEVASSVSFQDVVALHVEMEKLCSPRGQTSECYLNSALLQLSADVNSAPLLSADVNSAPLLSADVNSVHIQYSAVFLMS
jgi:hypothetical protein